MCVCLLSSPLLYSDGCLVVTSCLCDADSFSVSLQTLPSACEEGCSGGRFRSLHSVFVVFSSCYHLARVFVTT